MQNMVLKSVLAGFLLIRSCHFYVNNEKICFSFSVEMEKATFLATMKIVSSELAVFICHNYPQTSQTFRPLNTFYVLDISGCYLDLPVSSHFTTGLHRVAPPQIKSALSIDGFQIHTQSVFLLAWLNTPYDSKGRVNALHVYLCKKTNKTNEGAFFHY